MLTFKWYFVPDININVHLVCITKVLMLHTKLYWKVFYVLEISGFLLNTGSSNWDVINQYQLKTVSWHQGLQLILLKNKHIFWEEEYIFSHFVIFSHF